MNIDEELNYIMNLTSCCKERELLVKGINLQFLYLKNMINDLPQDIKLLKIIYDRNINLIEEMKKRYI